MRKVLRIKRIKIRKTADIREVQIMFQYGIAWKIAIVEVLNPQIVSNSGGVEKAVKTNCCKKLKI
ncbi:hypothetical protein MUP06_00970 [Patescibacteria group bacterium]|nr:hypothetical protein [Patescibacteria group bacterium]